MAEAKPKPKRDTVLDVTEEQIARTYAQAFLDTAGEASEAAVAELEGFCTEVLDTHPMFAGMLDSAFMDHEKRAAILDKLLGGKALPATLNLLKVLSAKGRIGIVRTVARQSRKLFNERSNLADVLVRVASPIDDATIEHIKTTVRAHTGKEPVVEVEVVPEIIGGLEVRVGDTVYDGTVRTAFKKAHKTIVAQTVEAIETNPERFTLAS